jgi:hypothetical protein
VPSLFKRKSPEPVVDEPTPPAEDPRPKNYTPSKRELGKSTPKRRDDMRRRPEAPPANRREAMKKARVKAREDRVERRAAMMRGDEKYLLPRDQGPERALVRDIVDRRLTIGTWFFGGALPVLIGSSRAMPQIVQLVSNLLWATLALGTIADTALIAFQIRKYMRERFPKSTQRMSSLILYAGMRGLTFRRLRIPKPRVKIGQAI